MADAELIDELRAENKLLWQVIRTISKAVFVLGEVGLEAVETHGRKDCESCRIVHSCFELMRENPRLLGDA